MKSGNLNFLEPSGPLQVCNGTALSFTYTSFIVKESGLQSVILSKYITARHRYSRSFTKICQFVSFIPTIFRYRLQSGTRNQMEICIQLFKRICIQLFNRICIQLLTEFRRGNSTSLEPENNFKIQPTLRFMPSGIRCRVHCYRCFWRVFCLLVQGISSPRRLD
jgi:hypothetical protein